MEAVRRLPAHLAAQVREFREGRRTPAEPRLAASVVLVRSGARPEAGGLEVYLLRRHLDMAFAGGMAVFPGGGVDPRDFAADHGTAARDWLGPTPEEWAETLGIEVSQARALVCAAVRETFEESGVLLAGPDADSVVTDTTSPDWEEDRRRLEAGELSLTDLLAERDLRLRSDLLRAWSSWLTPTFEPRRYLAWFFVAEVPPGQEARDHTPESVEADWMPVAEALTAVDEKRMLVLPPQYCTFLELFDCRTPADVFAAAPGQDLRTVEPDAVLDGDTASIDLPDRLVALHRSVAARLRP
jgi:8-oxo-dGTP pyrophosphatase MutT (NUDIX family)